MTSTFVYSNLVAAVALASVAAVAPARAQGCEPIRFTTPVGLGGKGEAYQREQQWRFTLAYRRLFSDQFFVGSTQSTTGTSPVFDINTFVGDVAYAPSDRLLLHLSIPVQTGSESRTRADGQVHAQSVSGIGDLSVIAETWLLAPKTHERGNISLGLGLKAPTGRTLAPTTDWTATGATVPSTAQPTIQTGDGGWAILPSVQAFRQIGKYTYIYANGSYMVSPKAQSAALFLPDVHWSVPDSYSMSVGASFSVLPEQGLSVSLGGRLDGTPLHDLIGGGDDVTAKRTFQVEFIDPGATWSHGKDSFTLSVPVRVHVNRFQSVTERKFNVPGAGGFAKYLVFASYSHRL